LSRRIALAFSGVEIKLASLVSVFSAILNLHLLTRQ
jgi:hypothetical protein